MDDRDRSPDAPLVVAYVSGHGFGHAVRTSVILSQLAERIPGMRAVVKTTAPSWLFAALGDWVQVIRAEVDAPPVQTDAFSMQIGATLDAMRTWLDGRESWLQGEVKWLRLHRPSLVLADISPLALAAADRAEIHSALVANFTWEWILRNAKLDDSRAPQIAEELASFTSLATWCFLTRPHAHDIDHPRPITVGLVGRRCPEDRGAVRARLGIDSNALVLLSFGGVDIAGEDFAPLAGLEGISFISTTPRPGLPECRTAACELTHACLMHASDAVVGKLGYCTVAEALIHGTPYLYAPRAHWPEEQLLRDALECHVPTSSIPLARLLSGQWGQDLRTLLTRGRGQEQIAYGGPQVAHVLAAVMGGGSSPAVSPPK